MRIGIITWFDGPNYGTNLQAIALQKYLRNSGRQVEIINIKPPVVNSAIKRSFWQRVTIQPLKYATKISNHKYKSDIENKLEKIRGEVHSNCIFTEEITDEEGFINACKRFEVLVFGSDQIWNPNWYHKLYYADYPEITSKKIAYAPSLGVSCVNKDQVKQLQRSLKSFESVSVREQDGADVLEAIIGIRPQVVVDPTFLLDATEWENTIELSENLTEDYVLTMFLADNRHHWKAAKRFATSHKMANVVLPYSGFSYLQSGIIKADAGLGDLLALIKGAKYVITDSYHITVFSLIFRKEFFSFLRFNDDGFASQNSRITNLLKIAGLEDRIVAYCSNRIIEPPEIDYSTVSEKLEYEIILSKQYLYEALNNEGQ